MSDEATPPEAPKKKRRKRHDPPSVNVLSDPTYDQVLNPRKGKSYWFVADEDMSTAVGRGWTRVERTPNGPRPAKYIESESGAGYKVNNQLTLMECDTERRDAIQKASEDRGNARMKNAREMAKHPEREDTDYLLYSGVKGVKTKFVQEAR